MAFLIIGGVTYDVLTQGAVRNAGVIVGESSRSFAGNLLSTRRTTKRQWTFTLGPLSNAQVDALDTATASGAFLTITGDAMPAGGVSCEVTLGDASYVQDTAQAVGFRRFVTVTLAEA